MREIDSRLAEIDHPGPPTPELRGLALASAACALGTPDTLREVLAAVLHRGASLPRLREALLQTYLFAGYPRAINALGALAELTGERIPEGLDLDMELGQDSIWRSRGEALCRRVYGGGYERLLRSMAAISPDLARWMVIEGYGKVLSRPALDAATRELCAVAALMVLRVPEQLRAHVRGALHVGVSGEEIREVLRTAAILTPGLLPEAEEISREVEARWKDRGAPRT